VTVQRSHFISTFSCVCFISISSSVFFFMEIKNDHNDAKENIIILLWSWHHTFKLYIFRQNSFLNLSETLELFGEELWRREKLIISKFRQWSANFIYEMENWYIEIKWTELNLYFYCYTCEIARNQLCFSI